jgi:hypothetical protein
MVNPLSRIPMGLLDSLGTVFTEDRIYTAIGKELCLMCQTVNLSMCRCPNDTCILLTDDKRAAIVAIIKKIKEVESARGKP